MSRKLGVGDVAILGRSNGLAGEDPILGGAPRWPDALRRPKRPAVKEGPWFVGELPEPSLIERWECTVDLDPTEEH
ncbi:MAG: hypothetical protein ACE5FG_12670 [Myxococcota bacterium]